METMDLQWARTIKWQSNMGSTNMSKKSWIYKEVGREGWGSQPVFGLI